MTNTIFLKWLMDSPVPAKTVQKNCTSVAKSWSARKAKETCTTTQTPNSEHQIKRAILAVADTPGEQVGEEGVDPANDAQYLSRGEFVIDYYALRDKLVSADIKRKYGFAQAADAPALFRQIQKFVAGKKWFGAEVQLIQQLDKTITKLRELCRDNNNLGEIVDIPDMPAFFRLIAEATLVDEQGVTSRFAAMATDPEYEPIAHLIPTMMSGLDYKIIEAELSKAISSDPKRDIGVLARYKRVYGSNAQIEKLMAATADNEQEALRIAEEMIPEEVSAGAAILRKKFVDRPEPVRRLLVDAYEKILVWMTPHELAVEAALLREIIIDESGCVRMTVGDAYRKLIVQMTPELRVAEVRIWREMFGYESQDFYESQGVRAAVVSTYEELISKMTREQLAVELVALRRTFKSRSNYARFTAVAVYVNQIEMMTPEEMSAGVVALKELQNDSSSTVRVYAKQGMQKLFSGLALKTID